MGYINSSSETANWGVNWRFIFNSENWSLKWKIIVIVALLLFVLKLEFWILSYLLEYYEPSFQIISASVSIQESTWSLGFSLKSDKSELCYEYIKVSVQEGMSSDKFSMAVVIPSFTQPPNNITLINSTIAMGSWPRYNATDHVQVSRKMAEYGMVFNTLVRFEFVYTPGNRPRHTYSMYQLCGEVKAGIYPNATQGILLGGPVDCWGGWI